MAVAVPDCTVSIIARRIASAAPGWTASVHTLGSCSSISFAVAVDDLVDHAGHRHLTPVGDGRGDQRHLERRGADVVLADGHLGQAGGVLEEHPVAVQRGAEVGGHDRRGAVGKIDAAGSS